MQLAFQLQKKRSESKSVNNNLHNQRLWSQLTCTPPNCKLKYSLREYAKIEFQFASSTRRRRDYDYIHILACMPHVSLELLPRIARDCVVSSTLRLCEIARTQNIRSQNIIITKSHNNECCRVWCFSHLYICVRARVQNTIMRIAHIGTKNAHSLTAKPEKCAKSPPGDNLSHSPSLHTDDGPKIRCQFSDRHLLDGWLLLVQKSPCTKFRDEWCKTESVRVCVWHGADASGVDHKLPPLADCAELAESPIDARLRVVESCVLSLCAHRSSICICVDSHAF